MSYARNTKDNNRPTRHNEQKNIILIEEKSSRAYCSNVSRYPHKVINRIRIPSKVEPFKIILAFCLIPLIMVKISYSSSTE